MEKGKVYCYKGAPHGAEGEGQLSITRCAAISVKLRSYFSQKHLEGAFGVWKGRFLLLCRAGITGAAWEQMWSFDCCVLSGCIILRLRFLLFAGDQNENKTSEQQQRSRHEKCYCVWHAGVSKQDGGELVQEQASFLGINKVQGCKGPWRAPLCYNSF